jgi:DNA primase
MFGKQVPNKMKPIKKLPTVKVYFPDNEQLNKAKQFPLENLYVGELKRTGKVLMGVCPFHQEDTPSFAIYPETNTWHCFGCGSSGDSVEFYSRLKGVDFKTALEELSK